MLTENDLTLLGRSSAAKATVKPKRLPLYVSLLLAVRAYAQRVFEWATQPNAGLPEYQQVCVRVNTGELRGGVRARTHAQLFSCLSKRPIRSICS